MILACNVRGTNIPKRRGAASWVVPEHFTSESIYEYRSCRPRLQSFGLPCTQSQATTAAICNLRWWLAARKQWLPLGLELTDTQLSDAEEALWNTREVSQARTEASTNIRHRPAPNSAPALCFAIGEEGRRRLSTNRNGRQTWGGIILECRR